jgi:hypothetical protein
LERIHQYGAYDMNEFSIELAAERIDNARTRAYFHEVLTSFVIGNTRSALVMLWSVVVCDLVYKLQELRDVYNDAPASDILKAIEESQRKNPTSPDWEKSLLEEVKKRTKLIDSAEYQGLVHLQEKRHLSAHPIIGNVDLLHRPTIEETRAAIRCALEATLLKPAVFAKGIIEEFVNDLAGKRDLFPENESLKRYLVARYFGRLQNEVEKHLFRSLWKFTFHLANADTDANRSINYRALVLLYERNPSRFDECIQQEQPFFSKVTDGDPTRALLKLLHDHPRLYTILTDTARVPLENAAKSNLDNFAIAWFLAKSPETHVNAVREWIEREQVVISSAIWKAFIEDCRQANVLQAGLDCGIAMYVRSRNFNTSDERFIHYIEPHLGEMCKECLERLIKGIESNSQTYSRGRARLDHPQIQAAFEALTGAKDGLNAYRQFLQSCV